MKFYIISFVIIQKQNYNWYTVTRTKITLKELKVYYYRIF